MSWLASENMADDHGISFIETGEWRKFSSKKRSSECTSSAQSSSRRRRSRESYRSPSEIIIKIISASYGPCEYSYFNDKDDDSPFPFMRDCTSFLLDLLLATQRRECQNFREQEQEDQHWRQCEIDKSNNIVRVAPTVDGKIQSFVHLLPGVGNSNDIFPLPSPSIPNDGLEFVSMNAIFGDPCPGKTKRLEVKYTVTEVFTNDNRSQISSTLPTLYGPTEIHTVSFAEHEPVKLRRYLTSTNTMSIMNEDEECRKATPAVNVSGDESKSCDYHSIDPEDKVSLKLKAGTSEIVLPIVLPFLALWERMQCRSICRFDLGKACVVWRTLFVCVTT